MQKVLGVLQRSECLCPPPIYLLGSNHLGVSIRSPLVGVIRLEGSAFVNGISYYKTGPRELPFTPTI
jgi:hypothetical protein